MNPSWKRWSHWHSDSCASLVKLFFLSFTLFYPAPSSTAWLSNGIFINLCHQRRKWEPRAAGPASGSAGRRNVTPAPPDDFVTFVYSRGLRGAPPRTIRGSIDWGTLFSAEHLVQSMTFGLTLTTSVSTAPQLLSNHSAVFIAWKRLGKEPFEVWNSRFQWGLLLFEESISFLRSNLVSHPMSVAILQVLRCV